MKRKLLLILVMFLSEITLTQAQEGKILHVVFEPDTTTWISGSGPDYWIYFDMDQDGFNEWVFRAWDCGHQAVGVIITPNANHFSDTLGLFTRLRVNEYLHVGDTITNCEEWPHPDYNLNIDEGSGAFPNQYVCMRYQVEDGYCYGWVHFSVEFYEPAPIYGPYYADVVLHEMAYCTIPNYSLIVGQTSLDWGTEENEATAFANLHPNPTIGQVTITGFNLKQAEVFNILGQRVATAKGEDERFIVDISNLPTGIYFVTITDEEGRKCVKKVVKE